MEQVSLKVPRFSWTSLSSSMTINTTSLATVCSFYLSHCVVIGLEFSFNHESVIHFLVSYNKFHWESYSYSHIVYQVWCCSIMRLRVSYEMMVNHSKSWVTTSSVQPLGWPHTNLVLSGQWLPIFWGATKRWRGMLRIQMALSWQPQAVLSWILQSYHVLLLGSSKDKDKKNAKESTGAPNNQP